MQDSAALDTNDGQLLELEVELYSVDTQSAFNPFPQSEIVLDTLSHHLVLVKEPIVNAMSDLTTALAPVIGPNSWKAPQPALDNLDKVLDAAVATILKVAYKGAALTLGNSK